MSIDPGQHRNRLAAESSAYLLQHAGNPVDWYPWGDEALALARRTNRPILLSIGYSACHWCHVMERECFENEAIAALMNEHFVCIKVDREERPDVDHLYMKALQGMTGRGGWPMTMFLTPDARPFYAGTYFPPEDRSGMPGFPRVLEGVAKTWAEQPDDAKKAAARVVAFVADRGEGGEPERTLSRDELLEAAASLTSAMDPVHGGFGRAPKFPGTMALSLLMQAELESPDDARRALVRLSLDRMAAGGIRDHLGGGFHRYSVDQVWLVPHFEKMLYDQALLAGLYTEAARFFDAAPYRDVAIEILEYVLGEMTSPEGGFHSAQDADSEGEEGKFFVWSQAEIDEVLGTERGRRFGTAYGVTAGGNFEGRTILNLLEDSPRPDAGELAAMRKELLQHRSRRVAPATDRKIVVDWNGLMISAMARAGVAFGRPDLIDSAERAAAFCRSLATASGGLTHVHPAGSTRVPAFLDDYAFLGRSCLDLLEARPQAVHFEGAVWCADRLLEGFLDAGRGGFYFTEARGETLVARTCDLHDGAVPAGNSIAAELMLRLWALTGDERYRKAGQSVIDRFLGDALRLPYGGAQVLGLADRLRRGLRTVVIVGEPAARERLSAMARDVYDPSLAVVALEKSSESWQPEAFHGKTAPAVGAGAYVCEGSTCSLPISREDELAGVLRERAPGAVS
jgi:uncharacterized protein YyaL (SSP411 family)